MVLFKKLSKSRASNEKINRFFRYAGNYAKKKYLMLEKNLGKKKKIFLLRLNGVKKRVKVLKKKHYFRAFYSLILFAKYKWLKKLRKFERFELWWQTPQARKWKLKKQMTRSRGIFYYPRRRAPKWYKSNRNVRLFKRFVRKYSWKKKEYAAIALKNILMQAQNYFRTVGCKKYFKQKIFIRAKFMRHYHGVEPKKMYSRWKYIKHARHKWLGFYKNFEGQAVRALKWAGLSYKYKLSKFLIDNNLVFLNGAAVTSERSLVAGGDILYLRRDIFDYLQKKKKIRILKQLLSKIPFFNSKLKSKVLVKALRARNRQFFMNVRKKDSAAILQAHEKILEGLEKNYSLRSDFAFNQNQPDVTLPARKAQWHRKVKKASYLYLKKFINTSKREKLFDVNADFDAMGSKENFLIKRDSTRMLFNIPGSVDSFYYGSDLKYTKTISPRTIKNFSERNYKY